GAWFPSLGLSKVTHSSVVGHHRVLVSPWLRIGQSPEYQGQPSTWLMRTSSTVLVILRYVALMPYDQARLMARWKPRMYSSWNTCFRSRATAVRTSSGAGTLPSVLTGPICAPTCGNR